MPDTVKVDVAQRYKMTTANQNNDSIILCYYTVSFGAGDHKAVACSYRHTEKEALN